MVMSKTQLQELLNEFGCTILNYSNGSIYVDHFYNEDRYIDFLNGVSCKQGVGLFDLDEELTFNQLKDNTLVIIQNDGVEVEKHRYLTIFKATMEYKHLDPDDKKSNKTLTFRIRKHEFKSVINFINTEGNSQDFKSIQEIKDYLYKEYGNNKLTDWSVYLG